jgi:hypothetical protein
MKRQRLMTSGVAGKSLALILGFSFSYHLINGEENQETINNFPRNQPDPGKGKCRPTR